MGMFDKFRKKSKEKRSYSGYPGDLDTWGNFSITSFFGDEQKITEVEALSIPAVSAATELITSSIAALPVYLYRKGPKGEILRVDDKRVFLLNNEPNDLINGYNFKKQVVKNYLFHGACYVKKESVRNEVLNLYILPTEWVTVTRWRKFGYQYTADVKLNLGDSVQDFAPEELITILRDSPDGITSNGILARNSDILRLALDEIDYTQGILKNGALPIGILKATSRLTQNAIDRLRSSWEGLYGGSKKAGKTIILEEGLDYHPISMKPNEMDLTNQKKSTISEICRIFNIPESMINSSANKYASNEQNNIYFLQYCISPILSAIESALNKSLLLEKEKEQGYYFRFDTSEVLRTTELEKVNTVVTAMKSGLYSINEARSKMNMPNIDIDYFTWNLGSVFYNPKTGEMTIPNMGTTIDPNNPQESMNQGQQPASGKSSEPSDANQGNGAQQIVDRPPDAGDLGPGQKIEANNIV